MNRAMTPRDHIGVKTRQFPINLTVGIERAGKFPTHRKMHLLQADIQALASSEETIEPCKNDAGTNGDKTKLT
jgi:hypothetical protein